MLSLAASTLAFVAMLTSVSLADEITAPLGSFTEPAMLPVGDAQTVGANINPNAQNRANTTKKGLDSFISRAPSKESGNTASNLDANAGWTHLIPKSRFFHVIPHE